MAKSFQMDLGNGHQPTGAGCLVIILAALVTFGVGISSMYWGDSIAGSDKHFRFRIGIAVGAGAVALGLGCAVLRALGIPFSRKKEE
jgi:hypothetical protein